MNLYKRLRIKDYLYTFCFFALALASCEEQEKMSSVNPENWSKRAADTSQLDSLEIGKTYLSIYSQIYNLSEHKRINLTATASLRNTSDTDSIYVLSAKYFDTHGKMIRTYFDQPIYLAPMETVEIIIDEEDVTGGTGSNFLFEWKASTTTPEPMFEGIMNSTNRQQGLSFTTQGKRVQ
ncbi:DUF3124 domain-containing protein [Nonlabens agnitus]|uniref:DUF3124 domain-containing protein n=1 Tax=Nonlabens agnitus TaxID=870484 RepID=A0A2S9WY68_9FLAO|nr:DUF3124 domain-containing protein [Nonlabens agnitus]PRP68412.1 hypothetical protein BST86_12880 [Nonlabens agnitus]